MRRNLICLAVIIASAFCSRAARADILINFDTITTNNIVNSYYNGGTDFLGEVGPSLGVDFQNLDWIVITGFGETSQPNFAYSNSGAGFVNVYGGFSSLSFTYGAFNNSVMSIYSGLNGTGTLLGSVLLPASTTSAFTPASVPFSGEAHSFVTSGPPASFGFDDLRIGTVPEPSSLALAGLGGIGLLVIAYRRRRLPTAS